MKRGTIWIMSLAATVLIGWDIYVALRPPAGDTISEIIWSIAFLPVVPYSFGVLSGHLFGMKIRSRPQPGPMLLLIVGGLLALTSLLMTWTVPPLAAVLTGLVLGNVYWGPAPTRETGHG